MADMPILPVLSPELLALVFAQFCLHCSGEYDQPSGIYTLQQLYHQRHPNDGRHQSQDPSGHSLGRHTLFSLCLVSRKFRDLAQPILYHDFSLGHGNSWQYERYTWDRRLISFLRTTTQRPDLGGLVKTVSIHPFLLDAISIDDARACLMQAADARGINLPEAWRQRAVTTPSDERKRWPLHFTSFLNCFWERNGDDEVQRRWNRALTTTSGFRTVAAELVPMLIAQLPNLEYFNLQPGDVWPKMRIVDSAFTALNLSTLHLKTLTIDGLNSPLLKLSPGLETLNLHLCYPSNAESTPTLPALTTLRITQSQITEYHLRILLSSCTRRLRTFVHEAFADIGVYNSPVAIMPAYNQFVPCEAMKHLEYYNHGETLKSLHLDHRQQHIVASADADKPAFSLKGFEALKHLFISSNVIYNGSELELDDPMSLVKRIPRSIRSLRISHHVETDGSQLKNGLINLADLKRRQPTEFPNLELIRCDTELEFDDTLEKLFASVGVDFGYDTWSLSEERPYLPSKSPAADE
ncbi:hypothetical protein BGZ61DRAFT_440374 [Ilyonectria robusta]|uniref:uncharacterized protein n=1 Tax=Ilyonectria robusta TaxID=1079257 RepID=UPI001E8E444C|nr:uncharacterized protein BGZ61DRAFT_440374 [Ilyonectria robusta]KAH8735500.1 hypothetical protein BGZ61DRAFT_440374 [Ilyonectria robusta]